MPVKCHREVSRITATLYNEIKAELHRPADDEKVMKKYQIGATTARAIRNTACYNEYREQRLRWHGRPDMAELERITREAKYDRRPYPKPESNIPDWVGKVITIVVLICICAMILGITVGVVRWGFGF